MMLVGEDDPEIDGNIVGQTPVMYCQQSQLPDLDHRHVDQQRPLCCAIEGSLTVTDPLALLQ